MKTWEEFVEECKKENKTFAEDYEEIKIMAQILGSIMSKRNELGLSQRELANLCGLPQSTIARIETYRIKPNLSTLIKIMKPLGLTLKVDNL